MSVTESTNMSKHCLWRNHKNTTMYLRRMGDKTFPDEAPSRLESFYPPWVAGIDLPQSRCCGFFDSFIDKAYFNIKTPWLSACRSCSTVLQIRKWCGFARAFMVTQSTVLLWFQIVYVIYQYFNPTNIKIYKSQLFGCRCTTYWCHVYFVECIYMPMNIN